MSRASRASRAKQFLPFEALVGFQELLREKEIEKEERKDLTEESYEELEYQLNRLTIGSMARIKYYRNKKYHEIEGTVTTIDYTKKKIQIEGVKNISVADIIKIEVA